MNGSVLSAQSQSLATDLVLGDLDLREGASHGLLDQSDGVGVGAAGELLLEGLGDSLLHAAEGVQLRPLLHGRLDEVTPVAVADGLRCDALLRTGVRLEPQRRRRELQRVLLLVLL